MDPVWRSYLRDLEQVRAVDPRVAGVSLRADDDGEGDGDGAQRLEGHFSVFNRFYEIDSWFEGHFMERIAPGAFKRTFNAAADSKDLHRIQVLLEHGHDPQVGDKPLGVPEELAEDDVGARYLARLFDASYVRDLLPALRAGVYGASFRFRPIRDEWNDEPEPSEENPQGIPERTIKEVRVFEFGPTLWPANPSATAGVRSLTDRYYESLRTRDPKTYDSLLARSREIPHSRRFTRPEGTGPDGLATAAPADPASRHSDGPTPRERREALFPFVSQEGSK